MNIISGFSKLSKLEKINYLVENFLNGSNFSKNKIKSFWHDSENEQRVFDDFSENTITNFYAPYGVVPNFLLNNKVHCIPMVIEESSVVAASAKAAKFWLERGGFKAEVVSTTKVGQVHFIWHGDSEKLFKVFEESKDELIASVDPLVVNMNKRGGGLLSLTLKECTDLEEGYYQLHGEFETCDAMGANFINSVLEAIGKKWQELVMTSDFLEETQRDIQVVMCILSNYTPNCLVKAWVECDIEELADRGLGMSAEEFANKFARAVRIARKDVNRAVTHNKGIFNGIDAVVLATGNDFRAIEACGHAYAARDGQYRSLSNCIVENGKFKFELELPLALGTVGGLTLLHPMSKISLDMLGMPNAKELMMITAAIGLAQNFGAVRSLVTTGIQKGHMKMHLMNILNHLEANDEEREKAKIEFDTQIISFNSVRDFIAGLRNYQ
ncbi:hydroxymethylglutaryl-CoA reductase, degradative [Halobacteriovorax sp. JY17]|uniref:hydroxymethylglutaryl-CoA reductase, degradative n=1 Tax=Halobacteriovorax sp. JY17 TaxID=2014617 RepID=UPI000C410653|nr:hydroxymethylglutaryl-CoA reductase, degradative [Halobacteriovorax sp. JY17]PIK15486.1 MAG: hydroxymethylglutaryl-CoA reductase, degradative [Halobacteriovorax sp. JY17]